MACTPKLSGGESMRGIDGALPDYFAAAAWLPLRAALLAGGRSLREGSRA